MKDTVKKGPASYENWKASLAGMPMQMAFEYPLYTDAHIIGNDIEDTGPYRLINCVNVFHKSRPALILYAEHYLTYDPEVKLETDDESYHGGYLQDEIAALVSLALGMRLKAGDPTRSYGLQDARGRPISYGYHKDPVPPAIDERPIVSSATGEHQLSAAALLLGLPKIEPSQAVAPVRAARLYQESVWICESTPELSWLMLTSAVETAAAEWSGITESPEESLKMWKPGLVTLLIESGGKTLVLKVAEELAGFIGSTRKFRDFLLNFLPTPPSRRPIEWAQHSWDHRTMKKSLGLIYDHRSRALHEGTPFPAPMCLAPMTVGDNPVPVEVPIGLSASTRGATWAAKDTPMLLHMFEYIARGALLGWFESLVSVD